MRLFLIAAILTVPMAVPAQARDSSPVQVKVSGFVRSTCRIEVRHVEMIVEPGCNVPWNVVRVPAEPGSNAKQPAGQKPASRIIIGPSI